MKMGPPCESERGRSKTGQEQKEKISVVLPSTFTDGKRPPSCLLSLCIKEGGGSPTGYKSGVGSEHAPWSWLLQVQPGNLCISSQQLQRQQFARIRELQLICPLTSCTASESL